MQLLLSSSFMAATNGATAARTTTTISIKLQRQAVEIKLSASKLDLLDKVPVFSPLCSPLLTVLLKICTLCSFAHFRFVFAFTVGVVSR